MHTCTLFPHSLFDGKKDVHAPSYHHHEGKICTGWRVHAPPFSSMFFALRKPCLGTDYGKGS
jgi:hypothetical protein